MKRITYFILLVFICSCSKEEHLKPGDKTKNNKFEILDLDRLSYTKGSNPLSFVSTAYGRANADGDRPSIMLAKTGWTHPSVLYIPEKWNSFPYWMAITPYPGGDSQYENPHIFHSVDGNNWMEPAGGINPITPCPEGVAYNSDVNLLLDNKKLLCYYRKSSFPTDRSLLVTETTDGQRWTDDKLVCQWPFKGIDMIAPSVIKDNDKYYTYAISTGEPIAGNYFNEIAIRRIVSSSPNQYPDLIRDVNYVKINVKNRPWGSGQDPWHLEVRKVGQLWMMLVTSTRHGGYGSSGSLYLGYSLNGIDFEFGNALGDIVGTYKSSFSALFDKDSNSLKVDVWRAMMVGGWQVYKDQCHIPVKNNRFFN
ncbi:hypothetical protein [Sphingobacterium sp. MYb382]|uniref:hypothetical protein n=1 Tax=Sphingobacterium sp. MYb382 TaxID=2745278 RepID=UPI0030A02C98